MHYEVFNYFLGLSRDKKKERPIALCIMHYEVFAGTLFSLKESNSADREDPSDQVRLVKILKKNLKKTRV